MSFSFHPSKHLIIEPHHPLIFYFLFSLLNFSSHYFQKKKKRRAAETKTKTSSSPYYSIPMVTLSSTFSFSLCLFTSPTTFCFTATLPSSFPISYNLTLLLPILFCINLISFLPFNLYFSHTKTEYSLSLSLSTFVWWIFDLSYTPIKVDDFVFKYLFWYCVFSISHCKIFSLPL